MIDGMKDLYKTMSLISKEAHQSKDLNIERGKKFQQFAKTGTRTGKIGLTKNSDATVKIQGKSHAPMAHKKSLVKHISLQVRGQSTEVGFFRKNPAKPEGGKLTYFTLALIHKNGYRIPLTGPKGKKVRGWLSAHGIYVRKTKTHLTVPPRDIIGKSLQHYTVRPFDDKIIKKWFDKLWNKI